MATLLWNFDPCLTVSFFWKVAKPAAIYIYIYPFMSKPKDVQDLTVSCAGLTCSSQIRWHQPLFLLRLHLSFPSLDQNNGKGRLIGETDAGPRQMTLAVYDAKIIEIIEIVISFICGIWETADPRLRPRRLVMFDFSCASACNPPNPGANTVKAIGTLHILELLKQSIEIGPSSRKEMERVQYIKTDQTISNHSIHMRHHSICLWRYARWTWRTLRSAMLRQHSRLLWVAVHFLRNSIAAVQKSIWIAKKIG